MAARNGVLLALYAAPAGVACDRQDGPAAGRGASPTGSASTAAVAVTRSVITMDGAHDMMARKEASPYTVSPSAELVLEVGDYRFSTHDGGPSAPDALHVAHGSSGYYRASFSGKRVTLNAVSLDAVKGGAFPGFEAGESYLVAVGAEVTSPTDGALRFTPVWTATVKVSAH